MALTKTYRVAGTETTTTEFGVVSTKAVVVNLQNAYIKVDTVTGDKENVTATVFTKIGEIVKTKFYRFVPDMNGSNFIKQSYEHLKTLPEFSDASDC
jgi:isoleucyl-tRNA synthetase